MDKWQQLDAMVYELKIALNKFAKEPYGKAENMVRLFTAV